VPSTFGVHLQCFPYGIGAALAREICFDRAKTFNQQRNQKRLKPLGSI